MFLAILATLFHVMAYIVYFCQVDEGSSIPNSATWTVWVFMATLNALTFWRGSKDKVATMQFFAGSVLCCVMWIYSLIMGKFIALDMLSWIILIVCLTACLVWYLTNAIYANLIVAAILVVSSMPTIMEIWRHHNTEQPLPWFLWMTAFAATSINVFKRTDKRKKYWWFLLVAPIVSVITDGTIAISSMFF